MNKETIQGILKMLFTATDEELQIIREKLSTEHQRAISPEGRRDLEYAMKLADEEAISRLLVSGLTQG